MHVRLRRTRAALAVALMALAYAACGDDSSGTGPTPTTVVGSWVATSLTAPSQPQWGDAVSDDGLSVSLTLTAAGGYTLSASGDDPADPWVCPGAASCSFSGTYSTSGNTMVFDEGTASESSATYTLSSGTLTITYGTNAVITDPYRIVLKPA